MIDELDRIMTTNGTIGVKSPDVWGQDRLAKFRSEYETQMSEWLKTAFKGEINASVRRGETEARRLQVGATLAEPAGKQASGEAETSMRMIRPDTLRDRSAAADAAPRGRSPAGEDVRRCSSRRSFSTSTRTT